MTRTGGRRVLAPEVVQTSGLDCGPAALKCVLEGFGISVSLGRLRDACQTDLDGTSIDTIEDVATKLGLACEQLVVPRDHVFAPGADVLPALAVTRLPGGVTHFVVLWGTFGRHAQVMDPAIGRRFVRCGSILDDLYKHSVPVAAGDWQAWAAGSVEFAGGLRQRLTSLGLARRRADALIAAAAGAPDWRALAALDAAARFAGSLVAAGGIARGGDALAFVSSLASRGATDASAIPAGFWSVSVRPHAGDSEAEDSEPAGPVLDMRGAVLLVFRGRRQASRAQVNGDDSPALPAELAAAVAGSSGRELSRLWQLIRQGGRAPLLALAVAVPLATAGTAIEALLLRFLFGGRDLLQGGHLRAGLVAAMVVFATMMLGLDTLILRTTASVGRQLEARFRRLFLQSLPGLDVRYFASRQRSDLIERSHSTTALRALPDLVVKLVRAAVQGLLLAAGLIWLDPGGVWTLLIFAAASLAMPLLSLPLVAERELRMRIHSGSVARYYFDALLGLIPARAHGADQAIGREQEGLLVQWTVAARRLLASTMVIEGVQGAVGIIMTAFLVFGYVSRMGTGGGLLLFCYWAMSLPMVGEEIAGATRMLAALRNVALRLVEPLDAAHAAAAGPQVADAPVALPAVASRRRIDSVEPVPGVAISFDNVSVRAGGHPVLVDVDLDIAAGSHVAIVGPSGAGKSTLVSLLLGTSIPGSGQLRLDHEPVSPQRIEALRRQTVWVDPAVYLWNRSLVHNVGYGADDDADERSLSLAIGAATLEDVLLRLPQGLQTSLGEGGALVSGGEGQRVRFARAIVRTDVRLVILDEPFRGLDGSRRRELLRRARELWKGATLLCITHDIGETASFNRVLCVSEGRVVEDGPPEALALQPGSVFRTLLEAEQVARDRLWSSQTWRRLEVTGGKLREVLARADAPKRSTREA